MESLLLENFRGYIIENHPELILNIAEGFSLNNFLGDKMEAIKPLMRTMLENGQPPYQVSQTCHSRLIQGLGPSKANYIKEILETEFPADCFRLRECGVLTYETVNLIEVCAEIFEAYNFSEQNLGDRFLRYAVIAGVQNYLYSQE